MYSNHICPPAVLKRNKQQKSFYRIIKTPVAGVPYFFKTFAEWHTNSPDERCISNRKKENACYSLSRHLTK